MKNLTGKVTTCASGRLVDVWYCRDARSWVVQLKTAEGDQIGEADYVGSRDWAAELGGRYVLAEGGKISKKGIDRTRAR